MFEAIYLKCQRNGSNATHAVSPSQNISRCYDISAKARNIVYQQILATHSGAICATRYSLVITILKDIEANSTLTGNYHVQHVENQFVRRHLTRTWPASTVSLETA